MISKLLYQLISGLAIACAVPGCSQAASAQPSAAIATHLAGLHSPWDLAPHLVTGDPFDCGPPAAIGPDLTVGSLDKKRQISDEVRDAAYSESTTALHDLARRVTAAADNFRDTGSREAAQCVVDLLSAAALGGAATGFIANKEGLFDQNKALRAFSVAFLKVRGSGVAAPQQSQTIMGWMERLVREERSFYDHEPCSPKDCDIDSHHGLETAMAAAAVGIAANDGGLVHWAEGRYRTAIRQIDDRGMLHYDLQGEYALKENLESAAALVQIAELGEINGVHLYAYDRGRIQLLVQTVARGLVDPTLFRNADHHEQKISSAIQPWQVSWASVYANRFPDPILIGLLHQAGPRAADMWIVEPW